jgi:hypothetical protein
VRTAVCEPCHSKVLFAQADEGEVAIDEPGTVRRAASERRIAPAEQGDAGVEKRGLAIIIIRDPELSNFEGQSLYLDHAVILIHLVQFSFIPRLITQNVPGTVTGEPMVPPLSV